MFPIGGRSITNYYKSFYNLACRQTLTTHQASLLRRHPTHSAGCIVGNKRGMDGNWRDCSGLDHVVEHGRWRFSRRRGGDSFLRTLQRSSLLSFYVHLVRFTSRKKRMASFTPVYDQPVTLAALNQLEPEILTQGPPRVLRVRVSQDTSETDPQHHFNRGHSVAEQHIPPRTLSNRITSFPR